MSNASTTQTFHLKSITKNTQLSEKVSKWLSNMRETDFNMANKQVCIHVFNHIGTAVCVQHST